MILGQEKKKKKAKRHATIDIHPKNQSHLESKIDFYNLQSLHDIEFLRRTFLNSERSNLCSFRVYVYICIGFSSTSKPLKLLRFVLFNTYIIYIAEIIYIIDYPEINC